MMRLFGRRPPTPTTRETIDRLRETMDLLEKREEFLQKKIERETQVARQNARKNKRVAMIALKKKKTYESQLDKLAAARLTLEQQLMAIEGSHVTLQTMNAMRMGANTMRQMHGEMTVDRVENTMDDIRDQMDIAAEISDAIGTPLGNEVLDDGDLERELAELEQENLDQALLDLQAPPVSAHQPVVVAPPARTAVSLQRASNDKVSEEDELRALEESMSFAS